MRPGAASTPVDTSTPRGRRWATAWATLSGRRPPETIRRSWSTTPSASRQSKTWPEPGFSPSTRRRSAPNSSKRTMVRSPAGKALMTVGTRARTHWVSSAVSCPCSCAAPRPAIRTASTMRWGASSRKTPTVRTCSGSRFTMSPASCTETCREEGAKMKPTAEAPKLTESSASASDVIPQILTKRSSVIAPRRDARPVRGAGPAGPRPARGSHRPRWRHSRPRPAGGRRPRRGSPTRPPRPPRPECAPPRRTARS